MNEIGKITCAGALVALGLGSAFLCGPPADAPQVVHEPVASSERLQLGPLGASDSTPSLHGRSDRAAQLARQLGSPRGSQPGRVILSAASEIDREEPRWQPRSTASESLAPPPRLVQMDEKATPLLAISPPHAISPDDWLLKPPKIPRTYGGQASPSGTAQTVASESTDRSAENDATAWWTHDTPRLQGLASNVSNAPGNGPQRTDAPVQPARQPQSSLAGPIDLDPPRATSATSNRVMPAEPKPTVPMRTHRVADGDTLARLATRYLRDPNRAKEIFDLNRDVIRHPELLPIGATLRIPGVPAEAEPELQDSLSGDRMVPVGPAPIAETRPQAQLQGPTPIAANSW